MTTTMKENSKLKGKKSSWSHEADFRIRNRKWLGYSSQVARRLLAAIDGTENMSQRVLADKIDVSVQYINKVLKGQENLTLKTIAQLSEAVGQELISFPAYKLSRAGAETVVPTPRTYWAGMTAIGVMWGATIAAGNSELTLTSDQEAGTNLYHTLINSSAMTLLPNPVGGAPGGRVVSSDLPK
jgi:transcriptional regulator with XRE-family HTH domain